MPARPRHPVIVITGASQGIRRGDIFNMGSVAGLVAHPGAGAFPALYRMTRRTVVEEIVLRPQLGDL